MEMLIPIVALIVSGIVLVLFFYFRHRTRSEIQLTVRAALEQGQQLTPEVLDSLTDSLNSRNGDLRRGVLWMAIGGAIFAFATLLDAEDAVGPLMGISAFPFLVGIAYLGLWFFLKRKTD